MFTPKIDCILCIVVFFKSQNYLMVRSRSQYIVELSLLGRMNYKTQVICVGRKIWLTGNIASIAACESDLGLNELLECTEGEIEEDLRRWRRWKRWRKWRRWRRWRKWGRCRRWYENSGGSDGCGNCWKDVEWKGLGVTSIWDRKRNCERFVSKVQN